MSPVSVSRLGACAEIVPLARLSSRLAMIADWQSRRTRCGLATGELEQGERKGCALPSLSSDIAIARLGGLMACGVSGQRCGRGTVDSVVFTRPRAILAIGKCCIFARKPFHRRERRGSANAA